MMNLTTRNIGEALINGGRILRETGITSHALDAQVILAQVLDKDRAWILSHPEYEPDGKTIRQFNHSIERRALYCPVQYIVNRQEFYSLDFYVDENVLIPRPETELLVERVIAAAGDKRANILDIGTGSGCIAVAVAKHCKNAKVFACDLSRPALDVAARNAAFHGVSDRIHFFYADFFTISFAAEVRSHTGGATDIIVMNPPYIETGRLRSLPASVRDYEPLTALDGKLDGLAFYRMISETGPKILENGGYLMCETGAGQAEAVRGILSGVYNDIEVINDLAGIGRVVLCKMHREKR